MSTELFIITHRTTGHIWVSDTGKWLWHSPGQRTAAWNRTHNKALAYREAVKWHNLGDADCRYERATVKLPLDLEDFEDWPESSVHEED